MRYEWRFPYNPDLIAVAKSLKMRWDPTIKCWWTQDAEIGEAIKSNAVPALAKKRAEAIAKAVAKSSATNAEISVPVNGELQYLPFQKAGIAYAIDVFKQGRLGVLIADQMGLGKTISSIGIINHFQNIKSILVICPASLKMNWEREMKKWLVKPYTIGIVNGKFPGTDIVIINYDIVKKFEKEIKSKVWDFLICDEVHRLKNHKTQRAQIILGAKNIETAEQRLTRESKGIEYNPWKIKPIVAVKTAMLTGSPIVNRPVELWNIIQALDPMGLGKNFFGFAKRYCAMEKTKYGMDVKGGSHLDELQERLRCSFMVRRLKKDVLKELPPKRRQIICLPMVPELKAFLEKEEAVLTKWKEIHEQIAIQTELAKASANSIEEYNDIVKGLTKDVHLSFEEIAQARKELAVAKIPFAIEHINDVLESVPKVVVFAHHHQVIDALKDAFPDSVVVDGRTKMTLRQEYVDRFQNDPKCNVFIGGIQAAGVGFTLTASSHVIFCELDWVPGIMSQAEDRCIVENSLAFCLRSGYTEDMSMTKIQDIKIGDKILTHGGKYQLVTDVHSKEHRGLITKIEYVGWNEPLECTHDHKILIKRDNQIIWIEAHQILPSDSMVFPKTKEYKELNFVDIEKKWRIYETGEKPKHCIVDGCNDPIEARGKCTTHYREELSLPNRPPKPEQINARYVRLPDKITIDEDWLYLFGWYVAEGFSSLLPNKSKFVSFSGHEKEEPTLMKIAKTLNNIGVKTCLYRSKKSKGIELRAHSGELAFWFRDWFGHLAKNKKLPEIILNLPPHQACIFLKGYTDGDGYQRRRLVEWVSASPILCYQMSLLAIRSGFIPTMRSVDAKKGKLWIGGYTKFGQGNKRLNDQDDDFIYRPVRKVETRYDKVRVYDLTVEKDHSFTVGFATVHNCHRFGQLDSVLIQHLVVDGSLDAHLADVLLQKQKVIDAALDQAISIKIPEMPMMPMKESASTNSIQPDKLGKIAEALDINDIAIITGCLKQLAGLDIDFAMVRNDIGFNRIDGRIGHELAQKQTLTPKQCALALLICRKYNNTQLGGTLTDTLKKIDI